MTDFKAFASGSKGNLYTVSDGSTTLMLECGLPVTQIRQALRYGLSDVIGCLLTHEHQDHAKAARDVVRAGVDLYTSKGTADSLGLAGHRVHLVESKKPFSVGTWRVFPFASVHDAREPMSFLLSSGTERVLFVTDSAYVRYRFPGLTLVAVECNYDLETLKSNVAAGVVDREVKRRVLKSHMSLENAKKLLKANDLRRVREIVLLHLSDNNSDARRFKREIQALTGKSVRIA